MPDDLVHVLLANPGLYTGPQHDPSDPEHPGGSVARVMVTPLPSNVGVAFDYEVHNPTNGVVHREHTVLAKTADGVVLFSAHSHSPTALRLRESSPGYFEPDAGASEFPMAIGIEVPEAGRIVYSWSYGQPGEKLQVRDVGTFQRVG